MSRRFVPAVLLSLVALAVTSTALSVTGQALSGRADDVVVHEWGTFTTVAGPDGQAVPWLPLGGQSDLPCFVHRYSDWLFKGVLLGPGPVLDYEQARRQLVGRVRMETPVLYFYSPDDVTLDVTVGFPRGLMTEWYPRAAVVQPFVEAGTFAHAGADSYIHWSGVRIAPTSSRRPRTTTEKSHYYAARETDASPLSVGAEVEKFLFYRGVGDFDVPITAVVLDDGTVRVRNTGSTTIPAALVFENRRGKIGYRLHGPFETQATLELPELSASFDDLRADLVRMLVNAGLYAREAEAMVETWRDSWFEEGLRVLYLVPPSTVDAILPLHTNPVTPAATRVFVGRMDVITAEDERSVAEAIARADLQALGARGRLLGPIADRLLAGPLAVEPGQVRALVNMVMARVAAPVAACPAVEGRN